MPWQQLVADVALEVDERGRFYYHLVIVSTPRQSGKTVLLGAVMDHRALTIPRARVYFTMQSQKDAVDWLFNEHYPILGPLGGEVHLRRMAGSEHVKFKRTEGLVRPFPPTPAGLHSKTSDLVVIDECWHFDIVRGQSLDQAIVPTQATKPNAQVWRVSTAGDQTSQWWLGTMEQGRAAASAGRTEGVAFFEWRCPDELDATDESSWPLYHPAYGLTVGAEAMTAALDQLGPDEFSRAFGNRWISSTSRVIPIDAWRNAVEPAADLPAARELTLGFDVAIDRSDAAIVAAWRDEAGVGHVEVADWRPGVSWLLERLVELSSRWGPVAIAYDAAGPALDVADAGERAGLTLLGLKAHDYAVACSAFLAAITSSPPSARYRQHAALDAAAASAARRTLGDAWAWGRRLSSTSLSPLTAATVALWAVDHAPEALGDFVIY